MLISALALSSCQQTPVGTGEVTTAPQQQAALPQNAEEAVNFCLEKTAESFFGGMKETFDFSKGTKTSIKLDAEKLANVKFEADLTTSFEKGNRFFGFNMKELKVRDNTLSGLRFYLTEDTMVAGFDSYMSKNYGLMFEHAEDQLVALVSKIMPTTSASSIRTEVRRYLNIFEDAVGDIASSGIPDITDDMIKDMQTVFFSSVSTEFGIADENITVKVTITAEDFLEIISDSVRVLKDSDEWRAYISELDTALRNYVLADEPIPSNATVLDYLINEIEIYFSDEGYMTEDVALVLEFTAGTDLLIKQAKASFTVKGRTLICADVNADYSDEGSISVVVSAFKSDRLGIDKDGEVFSVTLSKVKKDSTARGYRVRVENRVDDKYTTANTITAFDAEFVRDSRTNEYECTLFCSKGGSSECTPMYSAKGLCYMTKDEIFFSVTEFAVEETGVAALIDLTVRVTAPTESDLTLPSYGALGNINAADLKSITGFIEQFIPKSE